MADEIEVNQEQLQQKAEFDAQMQIALNGGLVPQNVQVTDEGNVSVVAPVIVPENAAPEVVAPIPFSFDVLKEKFGYEKPEDALTEIEQLRALKAAPPTAPLTFENEESEKLFKAWQGGKQDEVYKYLAEKNKLESLASQEVSRETAADIIKLGMQLKYKDLTPQEIDYKFNKEFALPKQPIQTVSEDDTDFEARMEEWKERVADIEMNKIISAKLAKPELESSKQKLVLPTLPESIDEGYNQYLKMLEENAKINDSVKEAYKSFTPEQAETKIKFIDEANKIDFEASYKPDSESLAKAIEIVSDQDKFYKAFFNSDGTPNREAFLDAILWRLDKNKIATEFIKQGSNARIKAQLPNNDEGGLIRQMPNTQQLSDLDKQMQQAGIGR